MHQTFVIHYDCRKTYKDIFIPNHANKKKFFTNVSIRMQSSTNLIRVQWTLLIWSCWFQSLLQENVEYSYFDWIAHFVGVRIEFRINMISITNKNQLANHLSHMNSILPAIKQNYCKHMLSTQLVGLVFMKLSVSQK